ncbi:hypothetical protein [Rothia nasimurium]|uniref:hypothetical protein n=1 Tax=Rothia nasimurium TaxID=85336 RepID=UPI001F398CD6|nr:hypothetical protein [Rothia nasimurium]
MSFMSKFRRSAKEEKPLTEAEKQAAPGQHFAPATAPDRAQLTVRRAPSLPAFAITGLLLGLILAFFVTAFGPEHAQYTFGTVYGVMAVLCGTVCTVLALILALVLERRSTRRTTTYTAQSTGE